MYSYTFVFLHSSCIINVKNLPTYQSESPMFSTNDSIENSMKAFYRFECSIIGRSERCNRRKNPNSDISSNRSAVAAAAYRSGTSIKDLELGKTFDYRNRLGIFATRIIAPAGAPAWVQCRPTLWNRSQAAETYKNAQLAREILLSLPKQLSLEDCRDLVYEFVELNFVSQGMIADIAIHEPSRNADRGNVHAHVLLTMRSISKEGFGLKVREWNHKLLHTSWRVSWCELVNRYLEKAGLAIRVDHRSRATIDFEKGRHFDYSIDQFFHDETGAWSIERNDIAPEPSFLSDHSEFSVIVDGKPGQRMDVMDSSEQAIDKQDVAYHFQQLDDIDFERIEQTYQGLLNKINSDVSLSIHRKAEVESVILLAEQRLTRIKVLITEPTVQISQDKLELQMRIEESLLLTYSSEFYAKLRGLEDVAHNSVEISERQYTAKNARREYKKYIAEWNRRAVRDAAYSPTSKEFYKNINQLKEKEQKRWSKFNAKAIVNDWPLERIEKERDTLQKNLDFELADSFGLYSELSIGR